MKVSEEKLAELVRIAQDEEKAVLDSQRYGYATYSSEISDEGWKDVIRKVLEALDPVVGAYSLQSL